MDSGFIQTELQRIRLENERLRVSNAKKLPLSVSPACPAACVRYINILVVGGRASSSNSHGKSGRGGCRQYVNRHGPINSTFCLPYRCNHNGLHDGQDSFTRVTHKRVSSRSQRLAP